jgi:hypothetical protein
VDDLKKHMNCEDFNEIVHELADYKPIQATLRHAAASHIALCSDCASKLANASTVSRNLVLAAAAETESTPIRVKENLLTVFAELHPTQKTVVPFISKARETSWVERLLGPRLRWWTAATVALAAAILLAVVLPVWIGRSRPVAPAVASNDSAAPSRPTEVKPVPAPATVDTATIKVASNKPRPAGGRKLERVRRPVEIVAPTTGEYVALTYLAASTAMDSGTVVRVELSRSALASLGLPVNFEGNATSVKADVVIGDDGVAHAIRLVQ